MIAGRQLAFRLIAFAATALLAVAAARLLLSRDRLASDESKSQSATADASLGVSPAPDAGADAGIARGSNVPLQPLELGDLDEVPWQYRSRADEEAARRAAIERVRMRGDSTVSGVEVTDDLAAESQPVTGDGPESGVVSPAIVSMPGPGETIAGDRKIGPSLPPGGVPHAPPEAGGLRRPSAGPELPDGPASSLGGPELVPADPRAPGPGD